MKVKAIAPGFHNGRRRVGDEFEVADGSKASWFVAIADTTVKAPSAPAKPKGGKGDQPDAGLV